MELANITGPLVGHSPCHIRNTQDFVDQLKSIIMGMGNATHLMMLEGPLYISPRRTLPSPTSVPEGPWPSPSSGTIPMGVEDPLSPEGPDSAMPKPLATSSQVSQHMAMSEDIPTTVPISHSPSPPPASKTLTVASVPSTPWSGPHPRADPGALSEEVL